MKPLHIAIFNRAFYPEISATAQNVTELAEGLIRLHGCRVSVVAGMPQGMRETGWTPPKGTGLVRKERFGDILILRALGTAFPKKNLAGRICNYLTYFFSASLAGLKLDRPDAIIALTDPPIIGLSALLAGRRFRCPVVISYRDLFPEVARLLGGPRHPLIEQALHAVNRVLIRCSSRIVAIGEASRSRLIREKGAPAEKVTVIQNWADCSAIRPGPRQNPFSAAEGLDRRFVVMHAGNIGASQNLEILVEAAGKLRDLEDLLVVFVGEGVGKPALEQQAKQMGLANVRFIPFQPKEKLTETFSSADCFAVCLKPGIAGYITPSKLYGILAAGRPYLASIDPDCEVALVAREYECGLLARPGDPQDLADKIRLFHGNRAMTLAMGANARKAGLVFDLPNGVRAYYELCRTLAAH